MKKTIIIISLCFILLGCTGIPVPPDKSSYIGTWSNKDASYKLKIYQKGRVEYGEKGNWESSMSAPLQSFNEEDFTAGLWFIKKEFNVTKAPYTENNNWFMEIDGIKLKKKKQDGL